MKFRWGTLGKCFVILLVVFLIVYFLCISLILTLYNAIAGDKYGITLSALTLMALWPTVSFIVFYRQKYNDAVERREYLLAMENREFDVREERSKMWRDPVFRGELLAMGIAIALFAIPMFFWVIPDIIAFVIFDSIAWVSVRRRWINERLGG